MMNLVKRFNVVVAVVQTRYALQHTDMQAELYTFLLPSPSLSVPRFYSSLTLSNTQHINLIIVSILKLSQHIINE